ncbi:MAG: M6 family metalloprotease domain-containing protein [Fibrobacter sp.]|nr:M6 family metalloprotease domain-containing protein [Fibrobacter sp.]
MKKSHVLCGAILASGLVAGAFAAPSDPTPKTIDNDGDSIEIQTLGDEHYRFTRTVDGYLLETDESGVYFYVDAKGVRSNVKAKNAGHRSASDKAFLRALDKRKVLDAHQKKHPDRFKRRGEAKRPDWVPVVDSGKTVDADVPPVLRLPSAEAHSKGNIKFPVILVSASGSKTSVDSASLYKVLNQDNYTANGYTGSVRDYFSDQSSGVFKPSFDLFYVSLTNSLASYVGNEQQFVADAIKAMRAKYANFNAANYDSDGDGEVDATGFLYAGTVNSNGQELGGFQYELQWNAIGRQDAGNGKKFNSYFVISDQGYFPVFIHEFSHTMGLKDHYCVRSSDCYADYNGSTYQAPGAHFWDVMATGMYANGGKTPPSYSGFERAFMGWMNYTALTSSSAVTTITPLNTTNMAYKIPVSGSMDEWWVLENRQKTKWDAALPNHGMLIWHIDYDQASWDGDALNDDKAHQKIDVVEAGNIRVTGYYEGFESAYFVDDPFPGSQNVTSYGPFVSWSGKNQGIQLYSITEKNSKICFATQSGVNVGDCSGNVENSSSSVVSMSSSNVTTSSSSSGMASSSASVIPSESSSSVAAGESSSSVIPSIVEGSSSSTRSSSSVQPVVTTLNLSAQLTVSDNYVPVTVDLSQVAKALGISVGQVGGLYSAGSLTYGAVTPSGVLDETPSTAEAPGHWFDARGNVINWGAGAAIYSNLNLDAMTSSVGNYPNGVTVGETYTVAQALTCNGKQVIFKITVSVIGSMDQSSSSVVQNSSSSVIPNESSSSVIPSIVEGSSSSVYSGSSASVIPNESSSSVIPSIVEGSSSSIYSSSSVSSPDQYILALRESALPGAAMRVENGILLVNAPKKSQMTISVFDMLGNRIHFTKFAGGRYELDLNSFVGKVLLVRLNEGRKLLQQSRFVVKR